jgi:hypothetical protein
MQHLIKDFHPAGGKPCVSNALKQAAILGELNSEHI